MLVMVLEARSRLDVLIVTANLYFRDPRQQSNKIHVCIQTFVQTIPNRIHMQPWKYQTGKRCAPMTLALRAWITSSLTYL